MTLKMKQLVMAVAGLLMLLPLPLRAFCARDCQQTTQQEAPSGYGQYRDRSHNFGNGNTAVMGDVNIRVGHDNVVFKGFGGNASNNVFDNSVHSTVIMGNMKQ
ncbi:MAG: hypothetical protein Q7S98_00795 [Deltaproteobacteria bacterium]|nr:hypothetical protein [Deltaproteobacteria bacterium]